ncbi:putative calcium-transporting ATPase 13, plasma membrane-type [Trifolium repens]|nr:putative calcium-transporting ATPase 13, plasma membrane-type [Trifolium repens]
MSMTFLTNMNHIETLLNAPNTYTKRWHNAFMKIYCSRAFMSHFTNKSNKPKIAPTPSFTVVDLNSSPHSYTIDQETLIDIVKEKNIETLQNHGGVEAIASNLRINIEFWLF